MKGKISYIDQKRLHQAVNMFFSMGLTPFAASLQRPVDELQL